MTITTLVTIFTLLLAWRSTWCHSGTSCVTAGATTSSWRRETSA